MCFCSVDVNMGHDKLLAHNSHLSGEDRLVGLSIRNSSIAFLTSVESPEPINDRANHEPQKAPGAPITKKCCDRQEEFVSHRESVLFPDIIWLLFLHSWP